MMDGENVNNTGQLLEELGKIDDRHDREMMDVVHYTMRYLLGNGTTMTSESMDIAIGVMSGVIRNSSGVPAISAMHIMTLMLTHQEQHEFAAAYAAMTQAELKRTEFVEQSGIEFQ